jgi:hypothetical protein
MSTVTLSNGVEIDLLRRGQDLLGLGEIRIGGVPVRAGTVPVAAVLQTGHGMEYREFRLEEVREEGGRVVLDTVAVGYPHLYGEYRDEYDFPMAWPRVQAESCEDRVEWILQPESLTLDGVEYTGFSYALRYSSAERSIHSVTIQATWELGGRASGNTILSQGQIQPPVYRCAPETRFSSECLRRLDMADNPFGYSFQFGSRYSPVQCFDFQHGPAGCLYGFWPEFVAVKSLQQKNIGEEIAWVLDDYQFAESGEVTLPRKCILLAPAEGLGDEEARDRWERCRDHAQGIVRDAYGIPKTEVKPEVGMPYLTDLDEQGKLIMRIGKRVCRSEEALYAWGDMLKELAEQGVRRVFPEVTAQSDVTEWGYRYKLMTGVHGDLVLGSVCNVWHYHAADFWGGWPAWEYFYEKGQAAGIEIGQWCGMHLSDNAPIFQEHPEFIATHLNTRPHGGGYSFNLSFGLNWNVAWEWMLEQWAEWKRHGLDYIFFDSLGNYGLLGCDFKRGGEPNAPGLGKFVGGLAELGIRIFSVEGIGPFGVGRFGLSDNKREDVQASQAVAGQNDYSWWVRNEDMAIDTLPLLNPHPERTPEELQTQFFRFIANRALPSIYPIPDWLRDLWHTFNLLRPEMVNRRLLPGGLGVHWTGGAAELLFAYRPQQWPLATGAHAERIVAGKAEPVAAEGALRVLEARAGEAYRIVG